jgi:hypothetical protein
VPTATPVPTAPAWVQALRPVPLWSGPDELAIQLGTAARWDYLLIAQPQSGDRLFVQVARTQDYAWVDALSVGPSGAPPPGWPPADLPAPPQDLSVGWVATVADAALWADPDGTLPLGLAPAYTPLKQLDPQDGPRLHVQDAYSSADAWVDASTVGPIDPPEHIDPPGRWWGVSYVDGANLRPRPSTRSASIGELRSGQPIVVSGWVAGEEVIKDNPTWAVLGDSTYAYSSVLRPVALPAAPPPPASGLSFTRRWIDLNLLHQVVVAYEGRSAHVDRSAGLGDGARRVRDPAPRRKGDDAVVEPDWPRRAARRLQGRERALDAVLQRRRQSPARELLEAARRVRHPEQPRLRRPGRRGRPLFLGLGRRRRARGSPLLSWPASRNL